MVVDSRYAKEYAQAFGDAVLEAWNLELEPHGIWDVYRGAFSLSADAWTTSAYFEVGS